MTNSNEIGQLIDEEPPARLNGLVMRTDLAEFAVIIP